MPQEPRAQITERCPPACWRQPRGPAAQPTVGASSRLAGLPGARLILLGFDILAGAGAGAGAGVDLPHSRLRPAAGRQHSTHLQVLLPGLHPRLAVSTSAPVSFAKPDRILKLLVPCGLQQHSISATALLDRHSMKSYPKALTFLHLQAAAGRPGPRRLLRGPRRHRLRDIKQRRRLLRQRQPRLPAVMPRHLRLQQQPAGRGAVPRRPRPSRSVPYVRPDVFLYACC